MKLNFYDVDKTYTDYLRNFDNKVPYIQYKGKDKFLCGVVLTVNNINYYVPVSSNTNRFLSSFIIYDYKTNKKKFSTSSLRFSFMFPCPIECLRLKDIRKEPDKKYKVLTHKEYEYCNKHIDEIKNKALKIYKLSQNELFRKKYNLCNFRLLEEKYEKYIDTKKITN